MEQPSKLNLKKHLFQRGKDDNTCRSSCPSQGGVYCLGFIGAVIYFISTATDFWMGVLGVLKALVWPAFVVYGLLKSLGM